MFIVNRNSLLVAIMVPLMVSGCGGGGGKVAVNAADDVGRAWTSGAKNLGAPPRGPLQLGDETLRSTRTTTVKETIGELPSQKQLDEMSANVRAEVDAAAARLNAELKFHQDVGRLIGAIDKRRESVGVSATTISLHSVRPQSRLTDHAMKYLRDNTEGILHDVVCELAWNYMTVPEHTVVDNLLSTNAAEPTFGALFKQLLGRTGAAFTEAIATAGKRAYARQFTDPEAIDWFLWTDDVTEKSQQTMPGGGSTLTYPDGTRLTHELVYFARICLRPPT